MVLPRRLQPHEVVGIAALLGVIEKIPAGERSVFERQDNPEKMTFLQRRRAVRFNDFVTSLEDLGFSRPQIEEAFERYEQSRHSH